MQDRRYRRPRHREENPDPARRLPGARMLRGALYPNLIGVSARRRIRQIDQRQHRIHALIHPGRARCTPWLTVLSTLGDRERRVTDAPQPFDLRGRHAGHRYTGQLVGTSESDSAGTETSTAETLIEILPGVKAR